MQRQHAVGGDAHAVEDRRAARRGALAHAVPVVEQRQPRRVARHDREHAFLPLVERGDGDQVGEQRAGRNRISRRRAAAKTRRRAAASARRARLRRCRSGRPRARARTGRAAAPRSRRGAGFRGSEKWFCGICAMLASPSASSATTSASVACETSAPQFFRDCDRPQAGRRELPQSRARAGCGRGPGGGTQRNPVARRGGRQDSGVASALVNTMQQVGGVSIGTALPTPSRRPRRPIPRRAPHGAAGAGDRGHPRLHHGLRGVRGNLRSRRDPRDRPAAIQAAARGTQGRRRRPKLRPPPPHPPPQPAAAPRPPPRRTPVPPPPASRRSLRRTRFTRFR